MSQRATQAPEWWANPHKHDAQFLYFTAEGTSRLSHEDARKEAGDILQNKLTDYILLDIPETDLFDTIRTDRKLKLREFDTAHGNTEGLIGGTYYVWLMGRYPVNEYKQIRERLIRAETSSLQQAFEDQTVGIVCYEETDGNNKISKAMTKELNRRLISEGIHTVVDLNRLPGEPSALDTGTIEQIAQVYAQKKADAVFLTHLYIDPTRTGVQVDIPGSTEKADAFDARLLFMVIRTSDAHLLASDGTIGFSTRKNQLLNTILTHRNFLPEFAAAISQGLRLQKMDLVP